MFACEHLLQNPQPSKTRSKLNYLFFLLFPLIAKSFLTCYLSFHFWSGDIKNESKQLTSWSYSFVRTGCWGWAEVKSNNCLAATIDARNLRCGFSVLSLPTSPVAKHEPWVTLCGSKSISACAEIASEQFPVALWFVLETWQRESLEDDSDVPCSPGLSPCSSPATSHCSGCCIFNFSGFFLQSVL